ncbi:PAS domain-containing protein [Echinicola marina]|uniref:PAS domain-containing protein n=1 Tax=Echinicola marina TaxID=2859768 RepID=UPI001CF60A0D|nr:PAS domain-containing protein [Echinicola marina]UCS94240.1 PAS domain-containing protein [Echinicola marina]
MGTDFLLAFVLLHELPRLFGFFGVFLIGINAFLLVFAIIKSESIKTNKVCYGLAILCLLVQVNMLGSSLGFSQLSGANKYLEVLLGAVLLHFILGVYEQLSKCPVLLSLNYGFVVFLTLASLLMGGEGPSTVSFNVGPEHFVFDIIYFGFYVQITVALIYSLTGILRGDGFHSFWKISVILNLGIGLFLWLYLFMDSLAAEISFFSLKAFSFAILGFTGLWAMFEKSRIKMKMSSDRDVFLEKFKVPVLLISSWGGVLNLNSKARLFLGTGNGKSIPQLIDIVSCFEEKRRFEDKCMQLLFGSTCRKFSFEGKKLGGKIGRIWAEGQLLGIEGSEDEQLLLFLEDDVALISEKPKVDDFDEVYQIISSVSSEAMWQYDVQMDKLLFGDGFKNLFGIDLGKQEVGKDYIRSRIHPDDCERVFKNLEEITLDLERTAWEHEYRFLKENGEFARVKSRGYVLRDADGRPVKFCGAMQDVTFIYQYLKKINAQKAYFREIIQMQSHDVREPLTRIMAVANFILENGYSELEEKEALRIIANSCQELDGMIHQVIEKVERAQIDTKFIELNKGKDSLKNIGDMVK